MSDEQAVATNTVESEIIEVPVPEHSVEGDVENFAPSLAIHYLKHPEVHKTFINRFYEVGQELDKFSDECKIFMQNIMFEKEKEKRISLVKDELEKCKDEIIRFNKYASVSETIRETSSTHDAIRKGKVLGFVKELTENDAILEHSEREDLGIPTFNDWCKDNLIKMSKSSINNFIKLGNHSKQIEEENIAYLGQERLLSLISAAHEKDGKKKKPIKFRKFLNEYNIEIPDESDSNRKSEYMFKISVDAAVIHKKLIEKYGFEVELELVRDVLKANLLINKPVIERMKTESDNGNDPKKVLIKMIGDKKGFTGLPINKEINTQVNNFAKLLEKTNGDSEFKRSEIDIKALENLQGKIANLVNMS